MKSYSILYANEYYANAALSFEQIFTEWDYHKSEYAENSDILVIMDRSLLDDILLNEGITGKIILFVLKSDISRFFDIDISSIDHIIIGLDTNIKIIYPWPNLCSEITPPLPNINNSFNDNINSNEIFVNLEEQLYPDLALLKIIRSLNQLTNYKITVVSYSLPQTIFNNNITVIRPTSEVDSYIHSADIVIGAGYTAFNGFLLGKKVIIIGERGYGGIANKNNIALFYNDFFQGSIGGRIDGPIPETLLISDIQNADRHDYVQLKNYILEVQKENILNLSNIIQKVIFSDDFLETNYKFNSDYTIIKSSNESYWLLNRFTRRVIAKLSPILANKLLSMHNGTNTPIFTSEEIHDLIKQKILII